MRINVIREWLAVGLLVTTMAVAQAQQVPAKVAVVTEEERARLEIERTTAAILDFRKEHQIEFMMTQSRMLQETLGQIYPEVFHLELEITKATEIHKALEAIKDKPERFGTLPDSAPRLDEITSTFHVLQDTEAELTIMLTKFTEQHPEIKGKRKEIEVYREHFINATHRALETATANLALLQSLRKDRVSKRDELTENLKKMEVQIVAAQLKTEQLQREREVAQDVWTDLVRRKAEARAEKDIEAAERALREF